MITHKFRLYPNKEQETKMLKTLESCRNIYNMLLHELNEQKVIDKSIIQGTIPNIKICEPRFKEVYAKALHYECYRLFSNLSALVKTKAKGRKVGRLRFKGKNWFKTFTYNQSGFKIIETGKRCQLLHLSKIGEIPIRCHRNITGKIKQITIKKTQSGKWFASVCEETTKSNQITRINKVAGIDLGLTDLVYDSDNNKISNPRHLKQHKEKLAFLNRKLSKKIKGSNNRERMRIMLARQYEKLTNTRDDFLHKTSRYYVDKYDAIGMEDMPINNMVQGRYSKSILDASWGKLRQFVSYKAENAGKIFMLVDHRGTTQRCSKCQEEVRKDIWQRKHNCPHCGFTAPRDYNSAIEIKNLTISKIRQELPESTLVEMEGYSPMGQCSSEKQEVISLTSEGC